MPPPVAVLDACVLYPAVLRDLFMHLAVDDRIRPRWTDDIHDEWVRNVLADRSDLTADQLARTRRLMDAHVGDARVVGHDQLIPTLSLPDPDDRHVLAAAITGKAKWVVTFNLADFPAAGLAPHGVTAVHPDPFLAAVFDAGPTEFRRAVARQRGMLKHPPVTAAVFLDRLDRLGLPMTAARLLPDVDNL